MKCSYNSYANKRLSSPFCLSFFFSFTGFFEQWALYFYLLLFFFLHEQCCLFAFPSLVVILKHSISFINSIPYLMVDPSHPFITVLMMLVLKRDSLDIPNIDTFSFSLSSLCLFSQILSPIYSNQPLHQDADKKPRLFPPQGKRDCL